MLQHCKIGLACVREWPHAVHAGSARQSHEGSRRETKKTLPGMRRSTTAFDAEYGALPSSSDSAAEAGEYFCHPSRERGHRANWVIRSIAATVCVECYRRLRRPNSTPSLRTALYCGDLLELRFYRVLQHTRTWGCRNSEHARTGSANWVAQIIKLSASLAAVSSILFMGNGAL
jgi:hypothetical protein